MANVFYTFTPILDRPQVRVLNRAIEENADCNDLYKVSAHKKLIADIRKELEILYIKNNLTQNEIKKNLSIFDLKTRDIASDRLSALGRMQNLFKQDSKEVIETANIQNKTAQNPENMIHNESTAMIIDVNGQVFFNDVFNVIPTDIKLNFENKEKNTPAFYGLIPKTLTSDIIVRELKSFKYKYRIFKNQVKTIYYKIILKIFPQYLKKLKNTL